MVRENQRFATYKALLQGKKVFVKQARTTRLQESIRAELWGLHSFAELARAQTLPFEIPRILFSGTDFLVTTWAPGNPMRITARSMTAREDIAVLADMFASIDSATRLSRYVPSNYTMAGDGASDEAERVTNVLSTVPYGDYFDKRVVGKAIAKLRRDIAIPTARLTHADLTPQHILRTPGGRTTVIDYDSCSLLWPRFYDVVNYAYNAVVHDVESLALSTELLELYFEQIGESVDRHRRSLNVVAAARGLYSIYEHLSAPDEGHNTTDSLTDERVEFIEQSLSLISRGRFFLPA